MKKQRTNAFETKQPNKHQKVRSAVGWGIFFGLLAVGTRAVLFLNGDTSELNIVSSIASANVFSGTPNTGILVGWFVQFALGFIIGYSIIKLLNLKRHPNE